MQEQKNGEGFDPKQKPSGPSSPVPPKWGGQSPGESAGPGKADVFSGPELSLDPAAGSGPAGASRNTSAHFGPGGAWLWLPHGVEPKKSWRKRHPFLFWGGLVLLLLLVWNAGRASMVSFSDKIAVINVEGVILDADSVIEWIEQVRRDDSVKGALVRINSPGGAVGPSQEIYLAVKRLQKTKPVVASMGSVAASGGYYVALGAKEIFAGPSTLTANIGVKMQVPNVEKLMDAVGITEKTLATGPLKDAGSAWRKMTPEEENYLRSLLQDMYDEFVTTLSKERGIAMEQALSLADGRAMTGRQAVQAKLVDYLGDKQDALRALKAHCNIPAGFQVTLVEGPKKKLDYVRDVLLSLFRAALEEKAALEHPAFFY